MPTLSFDAERLLTRMRSMSHIAVALSGGVDSSVVAAAAYRASEMTGGKICAVAVTAVSPSVPQWQIELAQQIAAEIGIEHQLMPTGETDRPEYQRNDARRCFYCKQTLYAAMVELIEALPGMTLVSGTNADDLGDYRPGIEAGRAAGVVAPLAELGFGKARVRELAGFFGLSNRDLPASPCLASRVAYGVPVTVERLHRIEQAEDWLRRHGFTELRVRLHPDELARIEVPRDQLFRLMELAEQASLCDQFRSWGFRFVTIDLDGFRSGNLNQTLVSIGHTRPDHDPTRPDHEAVH